MGRQMTRRRVKKRRTSAKNSGVKFAAFLGIMVLAVFLGFLTARFAVGPLIGFNADESPARIAEEKPASGTESSGSQDSTEGYALQFGAFSAEDGARKMQEALRKQGIETDLIESGGVYKVISPVVDTREKALDALKNLQDKQVEDVFITSFNQ